MEGDKRAIVCATMVVVPLLCLVFASARAAVLQPVTLDFQAVRESLVELADGRNVGFAKLSSGTQSLTNAKITARAAVRLFDKTKKKQIGNISVSDGGVAQFFDQGNYACQQKCGGPCDERERASPSPPPAQYSTPPWPTQPSWQDNTPSPEESYIPSMPDTEGEYDTAGKNAYNPPTPDTEGDNDTAGKNAYIPPTPNTEGDDDTAGEDAYNPSTPDKEGDDDTAGEDAYNPSTPDKEGNDDTAGEDEYNPSTPDTEKDDDTAGKDAYNPSTSGEGKDAYVPSTPSIPEDDDVPGKDRPSQNDQSNQNDIFIDPTGCCQCGKGSAKFIGWGKKECTRSCSNACSLPAWNRPRPTPKPKGKGCCNCEKGGAQYKGPGKKPCNKGCKGSCPWNPTNTPKPKHGECCACGKGGPIFIGWGKKGCNKSCSGSCPTPAWKDKRPNGKGCGKGGANSKGKGCTKGCNGSCPPPRYTITRKPKRVISPCGCLKLLTGLVKRGTKVKAAEEIKTVATEALRNENADPAVKDVTEALVQQALNQDLQPSSPITGKKLNGRPGSSKTGKKTLCVFTPDREYCVTQQKDLS